MSWIADRGKQTDKYYQDSLTDSETNPNNYEDFLDDLFGHSEESSYPKFPNTEFNHRRKVGLLKAKRDTNDRYNLGHRIRKEKYDRDGATIQIKARPKPGHSHNRQRGQRSRRHVGIHDEGGLQRLISTGNYDHCKWRLVLAGVSSQ